MSASGAGAILADRTTGHTATSAPSWIKRFSRAIRGATGPVIPDEAKEIREEQSRALAKSAFIFAGLGMNTIGLVMLDFWRQVGAYGWALAAGIVTVYGIWVLISFRSRRETDGRAFTRASIALLVVQGTFWGLMTNRLAAVAMPDQQDFSSWP